MYVVILSYGVLVASSPIAVSNIFLALFDISLFRVNILSIWRVLAEGVDMSFHFVCTASLSLFD